MSNIIFSVVIPCYNCELFLGDCLDSIFKNTYISKFNFEVILVNDGSQDKTLEIMESYSKIHSNIRIYNQINQGVSISRNKGIDLAQGSYICFIDADDWIEKDYFKSLHEYIENQPDIIEFGYFIEKNGQSIKSSNTRKLENKTKIKEFLVTTNQQEGFWFCYTRIFRRFFLLENKLKFNNTVKLGEDGLFILQSFSLANSIVNIPKNLYHIRINEFSVTQKKFKPNLLEEIENQYSIRKEFVFPNIDQNLVNKDLAYYYINRSLLMLMNNAINNPDKKQASKELRLIRNSKIYIKLFELYKYNWKSPRKSLIIKLFEYRQFWLLEKILRSMYR